MSKCVKLINCKVADRQPRKVVRTAFRACRSVICGTLQYDQLGGVNLRENKANKMQEFGDRRFPPALNDIYCADLISRFSHTRRRRAGHIRMVILINILCTVTAWAARGKGHETV